MKILQISTLDVQGGAARATYRLHKGLLQIGQNSLMLARYKLSDDPTVYAVSSMGKTDRLEQLCLQEIQNNYIDNNRTSISNTIFSLPYLGFDLTKLPQVLNADVINLHWVKDFQSPITIKKLLELGKPVVWTFHDMWAFTGGCHYSAGCTRYQQDCSVCPQLREDPDQLPSAILKDKLELIYHPNLVVVTPSRWLAECVNQSQLFKNHRIEVIPNSLETDIFSPLAKAEAKQKLGLKPDTVTLLIGADDGNEQRKGLSLLYEALQLCGANQQWENLVREDRLRLLCFGIPHQQLNHLQVPIIFLGKITSDEQLSQIYSAADLFVLPSLEDNLPNTLLESMSCGTPVVAFHVGGIADVVQDNLTGRMVSSGDSQQLAVAILECLFERNWSQKLGENCRRLMETEYSLPVQAKRYLNLYQELVPIQTEICEVKPCTSPPSFNLSSPLVSEMGASFQQVFYPLSLKILWEQWQRSQVRLEETQSQLQQTQTKYNQTCAELERSRELIVAMESSKFWKLRTAWFQLKQWLGLDSEVRS